MTKFTGYANYGVLAHEKQTIFTAPNPHSQAVHSERAEIELPEGFKLSFNTMQEPIITAPNGIDYTANEILDSWGDKPVFVWYDGNKERRTECKYTKI